MEEKRPSEKAGDVPQKTEQTPLSQLRWKDRAEAAKGGLLGFFIGLAVIVPGVSGSTVAILFRLYEKLLCALGNLLRAFKRCAAFLLPVAVGVVLGFALGFFAVRGLLQISPFAVIALFAGLMAGAYPAVTDQLKGERLTLPRACSFPWGCAFFPCFPLATALWKRSAGRSICCSCCWARSSPSRRWCRGFPPRRF